MKKRLIAYLTIFVSLFLLSACGGSGTSTSSTMLTGTAATGQAIDGKITIKDTKGTEKSVDVKLDGSFSLSSTNMTPPIFLKIVPTDGSATQYSYASTANQTVNLTPLTSLTLFLASNKADLGAIYDNWDGTSPTADQVIAAQKIINGNLQSQLSSASLDASTYNFFDQAFNADGSGIDGVLDNLSIAIDHFGGTFSFADNTNGTFTFDESIDTTGINLGGGGSGTPSANETPATIPASIAGTYQLKFSERTAGSGIANGTTTTFIVGTDGTLTIDAGIVLNNPVIYRGNQHEAIWFDKANKLGYSLSSLTSGFREINVANDTHYDQKGFTFYGQYRNATPVGFVCPDNAGSLSVSGNIATNAITGKIFCPSKKPILDPLLPKSLSFSDPGGPDYNAHPGAFLSLYHANGIDQGGSGYLLIKYKVGGDTWQIEQNSGVLGNSGIIVDSVAKTIKFSGSSTTILSASSGNATGQILLTGTLSYQ